MFSNDLIWSLYEVLVPIQIYLNSSLIICQLIYYIKEKELFIIKEKSDHIKVASIFIILFFSAANPKCKSRLYAVRVTGSILSLNFFVFRVRTLDAAYHHIPKNDGPIKQGTNRGAPFFFNKKIRNILKNKFSSDRLKNRCGKETLHHHYLYQSKVLLYISSVNQIVLFFKANASIQRFLSIVI